MVYSQTHGDAVGMSEVRSLKSEIEKFGFFIFLFFLFTSSAFCQSKPDSLTPPLDDYRHFIMPTAKPVNGGFFVFWELAFLQGGVGFENILSFSGVITFIPSVAFLSQFAFLQGKATLADEGG